jgi:hypothetical protein
MSAAPRYDRSHLFRNSSLRDEGGMAAGGPFAPTLVAAARTARNLVHHHWARAPQLVVRNGRHGWVWPDAASLPPATSAFDSRIGIQEYARLMAGVSVADTLQQIDAVFALVGGLLLPTRP